MYIVLLCLFSFTAAAHVALPNHLVYTGRGIGAGKHFMAMDVGFNAKKPSYDSVPVSLAYAFGFNKWDLAVSASYTLLQAYQVSFIQKYHFFSKNNFDFGVKGALGVVGAGMRIAPLVNVFFVGSSRWGDYEAALDVGFAPSLRHKTHTSFVGGGERSSLKGDRKNRRRGGKKKFSRWLSFFQVGTSHTYHWSSDLSATFSVRTNLKARLLALNIQVRHLF